MNLSEPSLLQGAGFSVQHFFDKNCFLIITFPVPHLGPLRARPSQVPATDHHELLASLVWAQTSGTERSSKVNCLSVCQFVCLLFLRFIRSFFHLPTAYLWNAKLAEPRPRTRFRGHAGSSFRVSGLFWLRGLRGCLV